MGTPRSLGLVVQKYGGSSVATVDSLRRVAERVVATAQAGKRVCVVVSAMGDKTDDLLDLARQITPSPSRRELDMLLSCGERISMALLSMAISELGHQAISFTGSQAGILTNHRHSGARIIEVRPVRVQDELDEGRIVIVAGFQGVSYKREITTLGRGGSDITAVALAGALGAEYCEICSDVAGVYSADPRVVDSAQLLDAISHDAMIELAEHGARVLHPEAVLFAKRLDITLYARATAHAPGEPGGTRIGPAADAGRAQGVAALGGVVRLRSPGHARTLLAELARAQIRVLAVDAGELEARADFLLDDVPDWASVRRALQAALPGLMIDEQLAAVSVVGERLGSSPADLAQAMGVADSLGIAVQGLSATPHRATLIVAPDRVDELVRALHALFIGAQAAG